MTFRVATFVKKIFEQWEFFSCFLSAANDIGH
jgi:hypothetical protein